MSTYTRFKTSQDMVEATRKVRVGGGGTGGYYISDAARYLCLIDVERRKKNLTPGELVVCVIYSMLENNSQSDVN